MAGAVGGDETPFAVLRFQGGEVQRPGHAVKRGGYAPAALVAGDPGGELHPAAIGTGHKAVVGEPDGEGNAVSFQPERFRFGVRRQTLPLASGSNAFGDTWFSKVNRTRSG